MNPGDFCWHELMTSDVDAAARFYGDVVGWTMRDAGMPGMTYMLGCIGDRQVAGMMALTPEMTEAGARAGWFGYVAVDDVDAKADEAKVGGAALHRPPGDIPGVGRFAVLADPQDAAFMLFKGAGEAPADLPMETPGWPSWHELHTSDAAAAQAFYQDLFGWTLGEALDMGPMGTYQLFATSGEAMVGGMMRDPGANPHWLHYFTVEGIDAAAARVTAGGGTIAHGPAPVPGGSWIVQGSDPQGASFAIVGPRG